MGSELPRPGNCCWSCLDNSSTAPGGSGPGPTRARWPTSGAAARHSGSREQHARPGGSPHPADCRSRRAVRKGGRPHSIQQLRQQPHLAVRPPRGPGWGASGAMSSRRPGIQHQAQGDADSQASNAAPPRGWDCSAVRNLPILRRVLGPPDPLEHSTPRYSASARGGR